VCCAVATMLRASAACRAVYRATPVLRAEPWKKTSTGLTGLPVDPNARENMAKMQQAILNKIKLIPEHTTYRQVIEATSNYRLKVRLLSHTMLSHVSCKNARV
jgi:ETC complex I subunit conserved region